MPDISHPSPLATQLVTALVRHVEDDTRIVGVTLGGSGAFATMDEFSDLDFVIVCEDAEAAGVLSEAKGLARGLGPLLAAFTGEHVGEPRLLIALYGPPLLHVDLKFIGVSDLAERVEDGVIIWERDKMISAATSNGEAVWPRPDPQWIEDRFWIWIHYGASKLGRGELFECLDMLSYLRATVFGPLVAMKHGGRPQGVRRIETVAPDAVPLLAATVAAHSTESCAAAFEASIDLYRALRDTAGPIEVVRRPEAEFAATAYLATVAGRH